MTGPEHFKRAERAVERAEESLYSTYPNGGEGYVRACLGIARMRFDLATLQLAYAQHLESEHDDEC